MKDKTKIDIVSFRLNQEIVLLIFAIVGVILAFAWQDAMRSLVIESLGLDENSLSGKFAVALVLTIIAVVFLWLFIALLKAIIIAKSESEPK